MTDAPRTMSRRQLIRHSAWFGAAVGLAVAGGEVITHVAGTAAAKQVQARPTLRFAQVSDSHIGFSGGAGTRGDGWYSFDIAGVHVIALVNTLNLKKLGHLGVEQLEFVAKDVAALPNDTPIIVFSHIPLFAMYPDWGWGTDDAAQALSYLRRFSSVTCLNGHVHQVFSKTEGNVTFYSGTTTAYPLPHPGDGPAPKPVTLPAGGLHDALGIREVGYIRGQSALALKEHTLQRHSLML
ncbi:MAG: metallophosphoesterase family protein [Mycobacterium sp.]|uniref:metallophosphoesterase family protein n=1 Tax=Mycobacterium sp. TaxID=1785 RepID=UPI003F9EA032